MKNLKAWMSAMALVWGFTLAAGNDAQAETANKDKKQEKGMVTGTIVDEGGWAVRGAMVTVKNAAKRTATRSNGEFSIKASKGDTLVLTASVMETLEIAVKNVKPGKEITMKWLQSDNDQPVLMVEQMPQFPYGDHRAWIAKNIRYPLEAQKERRGGKVFVQFVVERDGRVSNVRVLAKGSCPYPDLHEEAIRVVRMMPNWRPGIQKGRTVRVNYTIPINFGL